MSLRGRALVGGLLGAAGLAFYLWAAVRAPVVRTADSAIDLDWARQGRGIVSPVEAPRHPPKPAYLLFLRTVIQAGPDASLDRRIAVVQSILLWLGISVACLLLGSRAGVAAALLLYVLLIGLLRLRDVCSMVMPEALTAALALPIAAALIRLPNRRAGGALLGAALAVLTLVRPNVGGTLLLLTVAAYALQRRGRDLLPVLIAGAAVLAPISALTRSADSLRGLSTPLAQGSLEYTWEPNPSGSVDPIEERRVMKENWRGFASGSGPDWRRLLVWRAGHTLLGTDFYDARWNPLYATADD